MSKMSGAELDQLDKWFDDHEEFLIPAPNKEDSDPPYKYIWDRDYDEVKAKLTELEEKEPGEYCYTLVDSGDGFILGGWHFINRFGYFISTKPIEDVDLCIRYW